MIIITKPIINQIYKKIKKYNNIVLARHISPDPDAIASQISLRDSIRATFPNKKVLAVGLSVVMAMGVLTGCGGSDTASAPAADNSPAKSINAPVAPISDKASRYDDASPPFKIKSPRGIITSPFLLIAQTKTLKLYSELV